jgi:hypothetical protein
LVGLGHGEEAKVGLDEIVKGETVCNGEAPVEEATELRGTGSQLLDLNTILASYILVGELNYEVVDVLGEALHLGAHCVKVEIVDNVVDLGNKGV